MKTLFLSIIGILIVNSSAAQLKVSNNKVIIYDKTNITNNDMNTYTPPSNLNIINRNYQSGFTIERLDSGNFVKAAAGSAGSAFFL